MLYIETLFSHPFVDQEQLGDLFWQISRRTIQETFISNKLKRILQRKTKKTKKGVERGQPLNLNIGPQNIFRYIGN